MLNYFIKISLKLNVNKYKFIIKKFKYLSLIVLKKSNKVNLIKIKVIK